MFFGRLIFCASVVLVSSANEVGDSGVTLTQKQSEAVVGFFHDLLRKGYEKDRLKFIHENALKLSEEEEAANLTFVASQNVYDVDGSLKEVRTIELALPKLTKTNIFPSRKTKDDDDLDLEKLTQVTDLLKVMSLLGLEAEITHFERNQDGDVTEGIYVDKDILYAYADGLHFVNETVRVDNEDVVEDHIKKLKSGDSILSVLRYDAQGNFLKENSTLVPELLVSVDEEYNEPEPEIIKSVLEELAEVAVTLKSKDEVPSRLVAKLETKHPGTFFYVITDEPNGAYVSKDFSLTVNYDFVGVDEYWRFVVYGYKPKAE